MRPRAEIRDPLEARILPVADHSSPTDAMVRPAASERRQGPAVAFPRRWSRRRPTRPGRSRRPARISRRRTGRQEPAGQPLTLPEAIELAFRHQPRLAGPAREHRAGPRAGADRLLDLPAHRGRQLRRGRVHLGVGGEPIRLGRGTQGFNFIPCLGAVPVGLNIETGYELAELKVQWLVCDFGRRLGRYEQAKLALDVAQLQTDRAFQTVANEVAVAYYGVLRARPSGGPPQDAVRRAEEAAATTPASWTREGVVERETVLRAEVLRAETRQQLHAADGGGVRGPGRAEPGDRPEVQRADPRRRAPGDPAVRPVARPIACRPRSGTAANSTWPSGRSRSPRRGPGGAGPTSPPRSSRTGPCSTSSSPARRASPTSPSGSSGSTGPSSRGAGGSPSPRGRLARPRGDGPGRVDRRQHRLPGQRGLPAAGHRPARHRRRPPGGGAGPRELPARAPRGPAKGRHADGDHRRPGLADPRRAELPERRVRLPDAIARLEYAMGSRSDSRRPLAHAASLPPEARLDGAAP